MDHHNEDISVMCSNGPVSTLSGMVSIRCTLGTRDVPTLVGLYRPLIVRCARGIELLFHLKDAIDERMCTLWLLLTILKKENIFKLNIFMIYYFT